MLAVRSVSCAYMIGSMAESVGLVSNRYVPAASSYKPSAASHPYVVKLKVNSDFLKTIDSQPFPLQHTYILLFRAIDSFVTSAARQNRHSVRVSLAQRPTEDPTAVALAAQLSGGWTPKPRGWSWRFIIISLASSLRLRLRLRGQLVSPQ